MFYITRFILSFVYCRRAELSPEWELNGTVFHQVIDGKLKSFTIPSTIKIINGYSVELTDLISFEIPSTVTKLTKNSLSEYWTIESLTLTTSIKQYHHFVFKNMARLKRIVIPPEWEYSARQLFRTENQCLQSLYLPTTVTSINYKEVTINHLREFTIPSQITKLDDYCFAYCNHLSKLNGIEHIQLFRKGCFLYCSKLNRIEYPIIERSIHKQLKRYITKDEITQLEKWTNLKCNDIIFNTDNDHWLHESSELNRRIIGKKQLLFLLETQNGELFGIYENTEISQTPMAWASTNDKSFVFNLRSNGRFETPIKYEYTTGAFAYLLHFRKDIKLISLSNIALYKSVDKEGYYYCPTWCVDFQSKEYPLCEGEKKKENEKVQVLFKWKRMIVIQMK